MKDNEHKVEMQGRWIILDDQRYQEWLKYIKNEHAREAQRKLLERDQGIRKYSAGALRFL